MQRRIVLLALLLSMNTGCASWVQKWKTDPLAVLQEAGGYIRTALNLARSAFEIWAATSPEEASGVRGSFTQVCAQVDRGLMVAQDGLRLAANARGPSPDTDALLRDAQAAIGHVHEFLSNLPGNSSAGRASDPTMREALEATQRASQGSR